MSEARQHRHFGRVSDTGMSTGARFTLLLWLSLLGAAASSSCGTGGVFSGDVTGVMDSGDAESDDTTQVDGDVDSGDEDVDADSADRDVQDTSDEDSDPGEDTGPGEDTAGEDTDSGETDPDTTGPCSPGSVRCVDTVWELCTAERVWTVGADCAASAQWCSGGSCADRLCDPDTPASCDGNDVSRCREDGSGFYIAETCDENGCANGECLGDCGDGVAAGEEECDGDDLRAAECGDWPDYSGDSLGCGESCRYDFSGCAVEPRVQGLSDGTLTTLVTRTGSGSSLATDGELLVVGGVRSGGEAYLYAFDGEHFVNTHVLDANTASDSLLGREIAIEGDLVINSDSSNDSPDENAGAAVGFIRDGEEWNRTPFFRAEDPDEGDFFGLEVEISGGTVFVSAPADDEKAGDAGAVQLFEVVEDELQHVGNLYASDASGNARFGSSMAVLGDRLIVGAPQDGAIGASIGAAYVFKREGEEWVEQHKINPLDPTTARSFGYAVAISEDRYYIGHLASSHDDAYRVGRVEVFEDTPEGPVFHSTITPTIPVENSYFGWEVAVLGRTVAVSAINETLDPVYLFVEDADGWRQVRRISSPTGTEVGFGDSFVFAHGHLIVAASGARTVWVFR